MNKKELYFQLKKQREDCEKEYNKALELFEGLITAINRNLINGTPQNNIPLKLVAKDYIEKLTRSNLAFLLACKKFNDFFDVTDYEINGVVKK